MRWWRLSVPCALISILFLLAAPSLAQEVVNRDTTAARAIALAGTVGTEWLGPSSRPPLALQVDGPWQGRGALALEQHLATRVIRNWWPDQVADVDAGAILDGFAGYLQTRSIEQLFDATYLRTAHSVDARPYLGGHIIWSFPGLRISRKTAARRDPYAALFDSLERWIGTPALQGAMFQVAQLPADRLTADAIVKTISDAAGQDLSWAFEAARHDVNYAVDALSTTSVTMSRRGDGIFPGRSTRRVGEFDSGDALQLRVLFADGSTTLVTWDGRDPSRTVQFRGPSPVIAASLDPDGIVTLDRNRLDNAIVPPAPTNVPVVKWAARWLVWFQHTMLSYGFLA